MTLDAMPLFLMHLRRDEAHRFRDAEERHDLKLCAAIAEEMLIGFSLRNVESLRSRLNNPGQVEEITLVSKAEQPDGRLLAQFDVRGDDGSSSFKYFLAREGKGWVIDKAYNLRALRTVGLIRTIAATIEAYNAEHNVYPQVKSIDTLERLLIDAWGTPIRYELSKDARSYRLVSAGEDRKFDSRKWGIPDRDLADFAEDLVFENGKFVRMWRMD
ncbi:MAG TPA: hypothetical protein VER58_05965 [Thermoanaerobaculia bacterium]|nr:hypothetical protein [Thermoanaerobaculia bacterium]